MNFSDVMLPRALNVACGSLRTRSWEAYLKRKIVGGLGQRRAEGGEVVVEDLCLMGDRNMDGMMIMAMFGDSN